LKEYSRKKTTSTFGFGNAPPIQIAELDADLNHTQPFLAVGKLDKTKGDPRPRLTAQTNSSPEQRPQIDLSVIYLDIQYDTNF
jgi:hypothetical protein